MLSLPSVCKQRCSHVRHIPTTREACNCKGDMLGVSCPLGAVLLILQPDGVKNSSLDTVQARLNTKPDEQQRGPPGVPP